VGEALQAPGTVFYPEQQRTFRQLDRSAIQGTLSRSDIERADKILRMFKEPKTLNRNWAKAELLIDLVLSGGAGEQLC
jgi:hypothetical protein